MTLLTQNLKPHCKSCSITFTNLCKCFRFQNNQLCICRYMYKTHDYSNIEHWVKKKKKKKRTNLLIVKIHIINENMFRGTPKSFRKRNCPLYMGVRIKQQVSVERGCIIWTPRWRCLNWENWFRKNWFSKGLYNNYQERGSWIMSIIWGIFN